MQHHLRLTSPYQEFVETRDRKRNEIGLQFYSTSVMSERKWTQECQEQTKIRELKKTIKYHALYVFLFGKSTQYVSGRIVTLCNPQLCLG